MSETEPIPFRRQEAAIRKSAHTQGSSLKASLASAFRREELDAILAVYARKVAAGEWRDYALEMGRERAIFSIFRRTSEYPIYRIEKNPRLARRQGAYSVVTATGLILKRGNDLRRVLAALDAPRLVNL